MIRYSISAVFLLLICTSVARGQILLQQTYTSVAAPIAEPGIDIRSVGATYHQVFWFPSPGVSSCTVAVDSSADGITWSSGGIIVGQTCTSTSSSVLITNTSANFVRVNVTNISGGTVTIIYKNYGNSLVVGGLGTANTLPVYTASNTLGNSNFTEVSGTSDTATGILSICGGSNKHHPWVDASCYGMKSDSGVTDNTTPCANLTAALVDGDTVVFQAGTPGTYYGFGTGSANPCVFSGSWNHIRCSSLAGGNANSGDSACRFRPGNVTLGAPTLASGVVITTATTGGTVAAGTYTKFEATELNPNGETTASPDYPSITTTGPTSTVTMVSPKWQGNAYIYVPFLNDGTHGIQCQTAADCDWINNDNGGTNCSGCGSPIPMSFSVKIKTLETNAQIPPGSSTATNGQAIITIGNLDPNATPVSGSVEIEGFNFEDFGSPVGGIGIAVISSNVPRVTRCDFGNWAAVGTGTTKGGGITTGTIAGTIYGGSDNHLLMPWGGVGLALLGGGTSGNWMQTHQLGHKNNTISFYATSRSGGVYVDFKWMNIGNGQVGLLTTGVGTVLSFAPQHWGLTSNSASCPTTCKPSIGVLLNGSGTISNTSWETGALTTEGAGTTSLTATITLATTSPNITITGSTAIFSQSATGAVVTITTIPKNFAIKRVLSATTADFETAPTSGQATTCAVSCNMTYFLNVGAVLMGVRNGIFTLRSGSVNPIAAMEDDGVSQTVVFTVNAFTGNGQILQTPKAALLSANNSVLQVGSSTANSNFVWAGQQASLSLCKTISPVVTVSASTTADQVLMNCDLPAGEMQPGENLSIWLAGIYSLPAASTATVNLKLKMCTASGCATGTVVTLVTITSAANGNAGAVTNNAFNFSGQFMTSGVIGDPITTTATMEAHGTMGIDQGAATTSADSFFSDTNTAVTASFDGTVEEFLTVTIAFSVASTSNTATQRQLFVQTN